MSEVFVAAAAVITGFSPRLRAASPATEEAEIDPTR